MHDLLHEGQLAAIHGGNLLVHGGKFLDTS